MIITIINGMDFSNYKDSLDKLIIANQLLNNSDDEVLIKIINYKVTRIIIMSINLYTYLEKMLTVILRS